MTRRIRIGVDVGGTFTDLVAKDQTSGRIWHRKERSTPDAPFRAILTGTAAILDDADATGPDVAFFGHGTTVITNMILERKGARLAVVTTEGFRDVLDLGRQARPHVYDYRVRRPAALAARRDRYEVAERIGASGEVVTALDPDDLAELAETLARRGYDAVAVCMLHSYRNPSHEQQAVEALRAALDDVYVSASHAIAPEYREYERFATTALNGFVGPRAVRYFAALETGLRDLGIDAPLYTVTSNAGLIDVDTVCRVPIRTALSGPAAGVAGIGRILAHHDLGDLVTFDVGGTSTDVAILPEGETRTARVRSVAGYPVLAPMVDIEVIGAGGGSIARLDPGGALTVGPESAGADPGPAAYGHGGTNATVTDAAVVLGRIGAGAGLLGNMEMDRDAAAKVVQEAVGTPLSLNETEAAQGILDIATAGMARTIRSAALSRGLEPENLCLVAYGGAGPLLCVDVATALGIGQVVVPDAPGTLCARAILVSDIARDFSVTHLLPLAGAARDDIARVFADMRAEGTNWLTGEGIAPEDHSFDCTVECRYEGQNFEIAVPYAIDRDDPTTLRAAFDAAHALTQGFSLPDREVEAVTFRLTARAPATLSEETTTPASPDTAKPRERQVHFAGQDWTTPIYSRQSLATGDQIPGPAVIEEATSTTVISPGWTCEVLFDGSLELTRQQEAPK